MQHVLPSPLQKDSVIAQKMSVLQVTLIAIETRIRSGTSMSNSYCLFQFQFLAERNQVRIVSFILVLSNMYANIQRQQKLMFAE